MLVLTRKTGEELLVGDAIIKVIAVRGDQVRLGIDADRSVPVKRLPPGRKTPAVQGAKHGG